MKIDTLKNRLRAVNAIASLEGELVDMAMIDIDKMKIKQLREVAKLANGALNNIYRLSHGYLSPCCKGKGVELIKPAILSYEGNL